MAEPGLIDAYLVELGYSVARLPDRDDIVAETEDHLRSTVDALVAGGASPADAEHQALARFGSAALVSRVFLEEAKRGAAVSTTFTRRAGIAAVAAPVLLLTALATGSIASSRQPLSGVSVILAIGGVGAAAVALAGLRKRHGGLGLIGRVAFWLAVVAVPLALPWGYAGLVVLAVEIGLVVLLYGVAMLRAGILPRAAVGVFAFTWPGWAPVAWVITELGDDANKYAVFPALATLAAFMWLGWAMWREPALDVRTHAGAGPLAV